MSSVSGSNSETCTGFPFADGVSCTGTNWTLNGFTDDVHDTESNLEHVWFRQLSGTQGRWTSPDPYLGSMDISNPQSLNRYGYVLNDPAGSVDPSGLVVNVPTALIDSFDGKTVLYEHFIDDGPELNFPRNFGGGGGGGGLGDFLGALLGGGLFGGGSIAGNCFLSGACPGLGVPGIGDLLPHLPAPGCDFGPCSGSSSGVGSNWLSSGTGSGGQARGCDGLEEGEERELELARQAQLIIKQGSPSVDWAGAFTIGMAMRAAIKGGVRAGAILEGAAIGVAAKATWFAAKAFVVSNYHGSKAALYGLAGTVAGCSNSWLPDFSVPPGRGR